MTTDIKMATEGRIARLREKFDDSELDAIIISNTENRRYFSGFKGSAGNLIISRDKAVLATDFRYTEQAGLQAPAFDVLQIRPALDWLHETLSDMGAKRIGFEADEMTVSGHERIRKALNEAAGDETTYTLIPTNGIGVGLRAVKDAQELALLTRAIEIGDKAFDDVSAQIKAGMTENEVAWEIEKSIREQGAESLSFETIVGSGPNGARPHHLAADRFIQEGEPIVIDMGCQYQGYCSDLTRTIVIGEPDAKFKEIYDITLTAQLTAIETVVAGMTGEDADMLARNVITEAGYGDNFGHSLGHGVGLEVHEGPGVGARAKGKLEDGMVFTIEPGIYLTGWGGVRIEDVVVLENGRARVISKARKVSP
ncbi:MAG: aminopeptidase P family protein [Chloroflexi bacterium]|nr:aminopeptidase P family protein [Chloroflexota bacterium]